MHKGFQGQTAQGPLPNHSKDHIAQLFKSTQYDARAPIGHGQPNSPQRKERHAPIGQGINRRTVKEGGINRQNLGQDQKQQ